MSPAAWLTGARSPCAGFAGAVRRRCRNRGHCVSRRAHSRRFRYRPRADPRVPAPAVLWRRDSSRAVWESARLRRAARTPNGPCPLGREAPDFSPPRLKNAPLATQAARNANARPLPVPQASRNQNEPPASTAQASRNPNIRPALAPHATEKRKQAPALPAARTDAPAPVAFLAMKWP